METLRIFISSPGDVAEERERARQVVQGLRRRYARSFDLLPVFWEDMPLGLEASFQEGIDFLLSRDRGVDIAVFILWSRLGSALGTRILAPDGREYRSGTERELDLMLQARAAQEGRRPHILAYMREDEASFEESLRGRSTAEKEEILQQKMLVESFVREEFHDKESGANLRAYHTYHRPQSFGERLRVHLQEILDRLSEGQEGTPAWDVDLCGPPFLGLASFSFEHAEIFFGREDEVSEARLRLAAAARRGTAFLLVSGGSGTGKSSLAAAGILPEIIAHETDDSIGRWLHASFTPAGLGGDPALGMARILAQTIPALGKRGDVADLAAGLEQGPEVTLKLALLPALKAEATKDGAVRLILHIDQLEELFTDPRLSEEARERFARILGALCSSGQVWIVATIRGDYYPRLFDSAGLLRLKQEGAELDLVPPGVDALRRMIESPALLAGLSYERTGETTLADRILRDVSGQAELLPLLEDLLRELFERRTPEGVLSVEAYDALGGIEGSLAKRAEASLATLPADVQITFPDVLRRLVAVGEGPDGTPVRRRAPLDAFPPGSPARRLVDRLVADRLATAAAGEDGTPEVSIAHEAILRVWPRVAAWTAENREFLVLRDRLTARMLEGAPLSSADPLHPAARALLGARRELLDPELAGYVERQITAIDERRRRRERSRRLASTGLLALAVAATVTAGAALWQWRAANAARDREADALTATRKTVVDMFTLQGLTAAEHDQPAEAVLWFANAADRAGPFPDRRDASLVRVEAWRRGIHEPVAVLPPIPFPIGDIRFDPTARFLRIQSIPSGDRSADRYGTTMNRCLVWSVDDGSMIPLPIGGWAISQWHPTASRLALGGSTGEVVIFSPAEKSIEAEWTTGDPVTAIAFSHDGGRLAVGGSTLQVYDAASGEPVAPAVPQAAPIEQIVFHPSDGAILVLSCGDGVARPYRLEEGAWSELPERPHEDNGPEGLRRDKGMIPIRFSRDGSHLLTARPNAVASWPLEDGDTAEVVHAAPGNLEGVAINPATGDLAVAGMRISVYPGTEDGSSFFRGSVPFTNSVPSVEYSPSGRLIAGAGIESVVKIADARSLEPFGPPIVHQGEVTHVTFSPLEDLIASAQSDRIVRVWRLSRTIGDDFHPGAVDDYLSTSRDGRSALPGGWNIQRTATTTRVFDCEARQWIGPTFTTKGYVNRALFDPSGTAIVLLTSSPAEVDGSGSQGFRQMSLSSHPGLIAVFDRATGAPAFPPIDTDSEPLQAVFLPDRRRLAVLCAAMELVVIDVAEGRVVRSIPLPGGYSPSANYGTLIDVTRGDQPRLVLADTNGLWILDAESLELKAIIDRIGVLGFDITADGSKVATASLSGEARVWALDDGRPLGPPLEHPNWVFRARFSSDGQRLLTAGRDRAARVWDWKSGRLAAPPMLHDEEVLDAGFHPLEGYVVTASRADTVAVWEWITGRQVSPRSDSQLFGRQGIVDVGFVDGGRRAVSCCQGVGLRITDMSFLVRPEGTVAGGELQSEAEVLSGKRVVDTGLTTLTTEQWLEAWRSLVDTRQVGRAGITDPAERTRWHRDQMQFGLVRSDWGTAVHHAKALLAAGDDDEDAHFVLGVAALQSGDAPAALESLSRCLALAPDRTDAHLARARAFEEAGRPDEAIADWEACVEVESDNPYFLSKLAEAQLAAGRHDAAARSYLRLGPDAMELWAFEGRGLFRLHDLRTRLTADHDGTLEGRILDAMLVLARNVATAREENPGALYNEACVLSLQATYHGRRMGNPEEAERRREESLATLGRAIDAGYGDVESLRTDPDLEAIRGTDEFARLLSRAEGEIPSP